MVLLAHADEGIAGACGFDTVRGDLLAALDVEELWRACISAVTASLPYHSCSLLFDIDKLQPRRGLHHRASPARPMPVTSLSVAAPFLQRHPRVRAYTFSQIASQDRLAHARLHAQDPAPSWRDFVHLAFWHDSGLDAVLSIRLDAPQAMLPASALAFIVDLHPLVDAALRRIRRLRAERHRQHMLEAQVQAATAVFGTDAARAAEACGTNQHRCNCRHVAVGDQRPPRQAGIGLRGGHGVSGLPREALAPTHPLQRLSPSERKVATMVGRGMRNAAIAEQLCRSPKTIENQITAIYRKLDIENRTQLARLLA